MLSYRVHPGSPATVLFVSLYSGLPRKERNSAVYRFLTRGRSPPNPDLLQGRFLEYYECSYTPLGRLKHKVTMVYPVLNGPVWIKTLQQLLDTAHESSAKGTINNAMVVAHR